MFDRGRRPGGRLDVLQAELGDGSEERPGPIFVVKHFTADALPLDLASAVPAEVRFGTLTFLAETASAPLAPGIIARIGDGRMAS
jgi:hypothetical protein